MLNKPIHQASGLLNTAHLNPPRLMALVSHGDDQAELPLLWRLCASLVELGYPVSVLDGTTTESGHNPGLSHVLDYAYWRSAPSDVPAWTVIPAALGLQTLCTLPDNQHTHLHELGSLFAQDTAILLYANAETLAHLLQDSHVQPVLAVSASQTALMTSYLAFKRLLLKGQLTPAVVTVQTAEPQPANAVTVDTIAHSLEDCAHYFLNHQLQLHHATLPATDDDPGPDIQRLALRMLENAMPLAYPTTSTTPQCADLPYRVGGTSMQHTARSN